MGVGTEDGSEDREEWDVMVGCPACVLHKSTGGLKFSPTPCPKPCTLMQGYIQLPQEWKPCSVHKDTTELSSCVPVGLYLPRAGPIFQWRP